MNLIKKIHKQFLKNDVYLSIIAFALSVLIASIIILFSGYSPIAAYGAMLSGAFIGRTHIATTLGVATPLIFTGLSMAISSKAGVFNIGAEGQMIIGAVTAALIGHYVHGLPAFLHILLCLFGGFIAGGIWAAIAAFMKIRKNISEVIATIMLNYIAYYFVEYLISHPFKAEGMTTRTEKILDTAVLPTLIAHTRLNAGLFIAIGCCIIMYFILKKCVSGYELCAVGSNPRAAEAAGISSKKRVFNAMFVAGAFAGIGGAIEVMGVQGYYITNMTVNYGYNGIAAAVMGQNSPIGTAVSALIFGALNSGAANMNRVTDIPSEFITILQALIIIFVSTPGIIRSIYRSWHKVFRNSRKGPIHE